MSTRKSMTLPIIITLIMIVIIIYLFATIKQTQVVCEKTKIFDDDVRLEERVVATLDGKNIEMLNVTKNVILPEKYNKATYLNSIEFSLRNTLDYLDNKVKYVVDGNTLSVRFSTDKKEVILLDNIEFINNGDLQVKINSNTKSSGVVTLSVGDNYTDGELMKHLKNNGYSCK